LFIKSKIQFFESKSQLLCLCHYICFGCLSSQRYNFLKANHNPLPASVPNGFVVYQVKDTIFWKQITTVIDSLSINPSLFIKSKIQFFESKSQHRSRMVINVIRCLSSQRYNFLKANHNWKHYTYHYHYVVYQVKDTIFWKQITTLHLMQLRIYLLFIKSKIQFFESKSQLQRVLSEYDNCCLSSQRYNFLKANHNRSISMKLPINVVYQVKDTIFWKQITTWTLSRTFIRSCLSSQRYNFLKANHNSLSMGL